MSYFSASSPRAPLPFATPALTAAGLVDENLVALSMHATPKATEVLASLAAPGNSAYLREKAAFWLGAQRGHEGLLALRHLLQSEQDSRAPPEAGL